jgi:hypothetical protein
MRNRERFRARLSITFLDECIRAAGGCPMSESISLLECLSDDAVWRLEAACCRFEQSWQAGQRPRLEDVLADAQGAERQALLRELLLLEVHYRRRAGEGPSAQDYQTRFPDATASSPGCRTSCCTPCRTCS